MRQQDGRTNGTTLVMEGNLRISIILIQSFSMTVVLCVGAVIYRQRKTVKAIATGMWTVLEAILLGKLILFSTVIVKSMQPSILRCVVEAWTREIGFIVCYGAILLKLYRHLVEFRTRKAHRWVVKDTDLLKYLAVMLLGVVTYMAAFTALTFDLRAEKLTLLETLHTDTGEQFQECKRLTWDYVTETVEVAILIFGIRLAYASRNARAQFHERSCLCASLCVELVVSVAFYTVRTWILPRFARPATVLIVYCARTQTSQTVSLVLIFAPKLWYQQKQVRHLAQDYSTTRVPLDAFKEQKSLSDVEIGEYSIADLSPDDIRTELKRLYLQLELLKAKDMRKDNPHISKRRGGRKTPHRRFSLQKKGSNNKRKKEPEIVEGELSRTPEESICSNEGPSAIYADLPSVNQTIS